MSDEGKPPITAFRYEDSKADQKETRSGSRAIAIFALLLGLVAASQSISTSNRLAALQSDLKSPSLYEQPADLDAFIARIRESVVVIECGDWFGSGWVIDLGSPTPDSTAEDKRISKQFPTEVITNHHVIEGCVDTPGKVKATAFDETYDAWLYSWDVENDLALVSIRQEVPALEIAQEPLPGYWSMAIGAPYGLEGSVSIGNVINTMVDYVVVSSAPLNSGNSGGPLVNSRGRVVGTNTASLHGEENAQDWNLAMAIPALCVAIVECEDDFAWTWGY